MAHQEAKFKFKFVSKIRFELEIGFFFFFFHCRNYLATFDGKSGSVMHEELKLKLGSHLGPKFELYFFSNFLLLQAL